MLSNSIRALVRFGCSLVLTLAVAGWLTTAAKAATGEHGEAEHADHPLATNCDDCDCCNSEFTCDLGHKWVCSFSGDSCDLHSSEDCSNQ
jgi:hypothetical protein